MRIEVCNLIVVEQTGEELQSACVGLYFFEIGVGSLMIHIGLWAKH